MPIKFRCEHCQQLLGISRSRAAATVDCPQCGRSLQVPGTAADVLTPNAQSEQPANSANADVDLMSALNELTMLGQGDDDWDSASSDSTSSDSTSAARPFDDSAVVFHGIDVPEERVRQKDAAVENVGLKNVVVDSHAAPSMNSTEALQDLASWASSEPTMSTNSPSPKIATDLLSEMRQASHPSSWLASSIAALLLVAISGASGWWLAKSESLEVWLGSDGNQDRVLGTEEDQQLGEADIFIPAAIRVDPSAWVISVSGQVQYIDESGQSLPDGGASVYLLPKIRQGNLKVHARSFRREVSNADRRFSEAALQALGGLRVEADADGKFLVGTQTQADEYQLVVVSLHKERLENMLPESNITNALMPWFDSTVHVLGKCDSVLKLLSESEQDLLITVGK